MSTNKKAYWPEIVQFFKNEFHMEPEIHNILFMIGVQELGYGFQQLNKDTKTKVINFATLFIAKFIYEEDRDLIRDEISNGTIKESDSEEKIYKLAVINYFREKEII